MYTLHRGPSILFISLVSRRRRRGATVSLLTWVSRRRAARRRRVATRTALRPGRTAGRRLVLLRRTSRRRLVLLLATVTALLLTVALLLLAELTRAWNLRGALFVLSVVAGVDGTENELENPKIRSEVNGRVGTSHLCRLVLVVGCAIHHASDGRVVVKLAQELSGW